MRGDWEEKEVVEWEGGAAEYVGRDIRVFWRMELSWELVVDVEGGRKVPVHDSLLSSQEPQLSAVPWGSSRRVLQAR